jgi:hypothetical protein
MIRTAVMVAGLVGAGALAVAPASADSLRVGGPGGSVTVQLGPDSSRVYRDHRRDDHRRDDDRRWDDRRDHRPVMRACTAERALWKAERMGVRRARVAFESRRAISVRGRDRRGPVELTFGRAPDCPLIR